MTRRGARRFGDRVAVRMGDQALTYAELDQEADALAAAFAGLGVRPGDRVAILAENCVEFVVVAFAAMKAGAWFVPLNFRYGPDELSYVLRDIAPRVVVAGPGYAAAVAGEAPRLVVLDEAESGLGVPYADLVKSGPGPVDLAEPDAVATVLYTSGTTGAPKGVLATHDATVRLLPVYAVEGDLRGGDVMLISMPLFHGGGLVIQLFPALAFGATVVLSGRGFTADNVLSLVERERVTITLWSPTMLAMLVRDDNLSRYDTSSLAKIWYGSSSIAGTVLARAREAFPRAGFFQWYGTTEATTIAVLRPEEHLERSDQTGREVFLVDARIVDADGAEVPVGEIGEVVVSSTGTGMVGYHAKPEATASAIRDGWLHTGDLAQRGTGGYFTIVDRMSDLIISGGENIYPREVEEVLHGHPAVAEASVFGVPDEVYGEAVAAAVVFRPGVEADCAELRAYVGERIARYKRPSTVVAVEELPRNASGKVLKRALREEFGARRGLS
ncbi:class I adenylate-forming enzyme family protein [Amycolatopsis jejuensis]|uniref:class I adenylate-forming enzyme family protein n=1 Tax=Amycolatopsis jejuensis TaxID=330084 RepID=UPI00068D001D|nr:AMP-binding protein [Amycolatopsis jejuensis]